jgi:hypothetical protein
MSIILPISVLLLSSGFVGFLIGLRHGVFVIALVAPIIIAVTAAITLRHVQFVPAVAITCASLSVNQIAYIIGLWLRTEINKSV